MYPAITLRPDCFGVMRVPKGMVQSVAKQITDSITTDLQYPYVVTNLGFEVVISAPDITTVRIVED